jgi:hypothetical protein
MPSILSEKQDMAAYYGTEALYAFMATGDPGTGTTVANEAAGGSPAYVRLPIPWSAPRLVRGDHGGCHVRPSGRDVHLRRVGVGGVGGNAHLLPAASDGVQPHRAGRLHADLSRTVHGRLSRPGGCHGDSSAD